MTLLGLEEVQIELTAMCNADCGFCVNRASFATEGRHTNGLDTAEVMRVIDWIADAGIPRIRFTGGEPMLRRDLLDLAEHAKSRGRTVIVNTNGFNVAEHASRLRQVADVVLLSFISSDPEITDEVMGRAGCHDAKVAALDALRGHPGLWVDTVLTEQTASDLTAIYEVLVTNGAGYWFILREEPSGPLAGGLRPQAENEAVRTRWEQAIPVLGELLERGELIIGIGNALPVCVSKDCKLVESLLVNSRGGNSSEGRRKVVVDPYGNVFMDRGLPIRVGKVLQDLEPIWNSPLGLQLRAPTTAPMECQTCVYFASCRGGSRLAAREAFSQIDSRDPLMNPLNV